MVVFWFLLALVLLVAAVVLLRLDARQRRGATPRETPPAVGDGASVDAEEQGDDDEVPPVTAPGDGQVDSRDQQEQEPGAPRLAPFQRPAAPGESTVEPVVEPAAQTQAEPLTEATIEPLAEPASEPSPRLIDRVRGLLPARRQNGGIPEQVGAPAADPLADSPVVRWLEDREFEPTPTPAPEFRHGDFASGLSALGTVSHGMFRGRRAIMGVTGGRTVLALRRDTASDVVLDLSRPDVDAEPGFHDAGEVAALEARTSDYGRLDLIDRDRLADAVREVPAGVRRLWAEGEWVAATVDGVDDPSNWDDAVMALHGMADVLAPFPPIGGRARALPAEIDPGSPGAADGPEADPTVGMDGEVGTGTHGVAATTLPAATLPAVTLPAVTLPAATLPAVTLPATTPVERAPEPAPSEPAPPESPEPPEPRRSGHLRLVPDRSGARDLSDVPVTPDRGDVPAEPAPAPADTKTAPGPVPADADADAEPAPDEPDPFDAIMEPSGPVPSRGDVAADHLAPRPPLSRPTRGVGQAYPEDASVPPLAAGAATGGTGIKPLGSEDDQDEIRSEVERFDAARIDGGSDLDTGAGGRHGSDPADAVSGEDTGRLSVAELAAKMGAAPTGGRRRHRRADPDDQDPAGQDLADQDPAGGEPGRERPGVEPDVEQTTRIQIPPDLRD